MNLAGQKKNTVELKTRGELQKMREAGLIAGHTLNEMSKYIEPGISTKELDQIAEKFIRRAGARPTFVGYHGYPASICVSINEEVVHGIPGPRKLEEGDIVSIDVGATLDGFVGDTAKTYFVGNVSDEVRKLADVTRESLDRAIELMRPGQRLGDIGSAVQVYVESHGYGVVRDFVGHGIGRQMHESPPVPNFGSPGTGLKLEVGLVLAIEPMVTAGDYQVKTLDDGWTVVTKDNSLAAHFEHTVAVTEDGPVVMTKVN